MFHKKKIHMKHRKKRTGLLRVWYFFLLIGSAFLTYYFLSIMSLSTDNTAFLRYILSESNHHQKETNHVETVVTSLVQFFSHVNFKDPTTILDHSYNGLVSEIDLDETIDLEEANNMSEYVNDPYPDKEQENPIVYLYNTHQLEQYSTKNVEPYNVVPNVMMTSYILREKLNNYGIPTLVEENNVTELLKMNNWNYASSYKVTKMLMEDAKRKNPSLKYFIDLHRDSVGRKISTVQIGEKSYAKIMFIVGLENQNYQSNLDFTMKIEQLLKEKYPGISRGIYKKQGKGVNGVYNQDFSPYTILIEMGGTENTIDEVLNSTEAVAEVLNIIFKEEK